MPQGTPATGEAQSLLVHIIICDQMRKILPHPQHGSSYAELFRRLLSSAAARAQLTLAFDEWDAVQQRLPPLPDPQADHTRELFVISGSQSDAFGRDAWIEGLRVFVRQAFARGARFMGVCFGHQVIAHALGGCVERGPAGFWGAGVRELALCDPLVRELAGQERLKLCVVHYDMVTRLPPGATLVGTSTTCPVESYRIGRQVLTFQGHPEITPDFLAHYIKHLCAHEPADAVARAMDTLKTPTDAQLVADVALRFFLHP